MSKLKLNKTTVCEFRTKDQLALEAKIEAKKRKDLDRKRHEQNRIKNQKKC